MLYTEFIEGTGCKANDHNYDVYKKLECLYMNWDGDITHAEIYEMGKKLVDNSLTEEQLAWNKKIDENIALAREHIDELKKDLVRYKENLEFSKEHGWEDVAFWKRELTWLRKTMSSEKAYIKEQKSLKYT